MPNNTNTSNDSDKTVIDEEKLNYDWNQYNLNKKRKSSKDLNKMFKKIRKNNNYKMNKKLRQLEINNMHYLNEYMDIHRRFTRLSIYIYILLLIAVVLQLTDQYMKNNLLESMAQKLLMNISDSNSSYCSVQNQTILKLII